MPTPTTPTSASPDRARLSQKLTAALAIAGLVVVVGGLSVYTIQRLIRATTRVDETATAIQELQAELSFLQDGETGQRGYLLTSDSAYLDPYHAAQRRADSVLARLRAHSDIGPTWTTEVDSLAGDVAAKFSELNESIGLHDRVGASAAIAMVRSNRGRDIMERARARVAALATAARQRHADEANARAALATGALDIIAVGSLIAFALAFVVNRAIRSDFLRRLRAEDELTRQTAALEQQNEESQALTEELTEASDQLQNALVDAEEGRASAEAAELRVTTILSSLPDAISVFGHDWRWRYVNPPAAAMLSALGKDPNAMIGRVVWDELPELGAATFATETRRALRDNMVTEFEEYLPALDTWFDNRVIPTTENVVTIMRDVTERKRAGENTQFTAELNAAIAEAPLDYGAALEALARFAVPRLADYCSIDVREPDGSIRRVAAVHRDPEKQVILREMWERFPYDPDAPFGSPLVLRTGEPQLVSAFPDTRTAAFAVNAEHARMLAALAPHSYVAVPLMGTSGVLGVLSFVMSDSRRRMTARSLELATMIAEGAGAHMERATLHRDAEIARDAARAAADRAEFLSRASQILASSLDFNVTLQHVAQLCAPGLADWCAVELVEPDGTNRQLAVAHTDPARVAWARELSRKYPPDPNATTGVPQVIRTGKSEFYPEIPAAMLRAAAVDDEHLRLLEELGFTSALVVPIAARDRVLGAVTLVSAESGRRFTRDDLELAEELGRRAGIAVENSMLYRAAEDARADAAAANRAKSDFLATMSHEIRTPINAVMGYSQLMEMGLSGPLTPQQRTQIERIGASTSHLLGLVNEILDLAKVESGRMAVDYEQAVTGETIDAALALLRPQAAAAGITMSEQCDGDRLSHFVGDVDRVRQVVTNLIANAVKFTPRGGRVTVSCSATLTPPPDSGLPAGQAFVAIRVADTGPGISAKHLARIFEPFTQAESGYTREKSGTGLGLTISRQLARLMGGEITVETELGKGSTFTLWMPAGG